MVKRLKNVVFDLGGVLLNLDFPKAIAAFDEAGILNAEERIQSFVREGIFQQLEEGKITPEKFRDAIRKEADHPLTDEEIDAMWNLIILDIPKEKLELILELRSKYMVYLLSNTNQIHWDYINENCFKLRGFRTEDYFEQIFLSFEMRLAKPDKAIFEKMMKKANLLPEETLFIDDSEVNCKAASELGIHVHHYHIGDDLRKIFE